eukprot:8236113-Heterocapsa_arctica.AAC.1
MLLQEECGGGPHDRRHKRGGFCGDKSMEEQSFLETGRYITEDRAHRLLLVNQTSAEEQIEQI